MCKTRVCRDCGVEQPLDNFNLAKGGMSTICKACKSKKAREKRAVQKIKVNRDVSCPWFLLTYPIQDQQPSRRSYER